MYAAREFVRSVTKARAAATLFSFLLFPCVRPSCADSLYARIKAGLLFSDCTERHGGGGVDGPGDRSDRGVWGAPVEQTGGPVVSRTPAGHESRVLLRRDPFVDLRQGHLAVAWSRAPARRLGRGILVHARARLSTLH